MIFGRKNKVQTDTELMQQIVAGDQAAFGELYCRYKDRMYYYFYRMLGNSDEQANDFLQELFMKLSILLRVPCVCSACPPRSRCVLFVVGCFPVGIGAVGKDFGFVTSFSEEERRWYSRVVSEERRQLDAAIQALDRLLVS